MHSVLSRSEAKALADDLGARRRRLDREELRWAVDAARLAASGYHLEVESPRASDFLRHHCRMGEGAVRDRLAVGNQIHRLPLTAQAMAEGRIGLGHVIVMAHTANARGQGFDERPLLEKALAESVGKFWHSCQNYLHACDPDRFANTAELQFEQRELTMRRRQDGMYTIWGRMDAVGVATWRAALAPMVRRRGRHDHRTHAQRLHDAVVEHAAGHQVTQLNVTVSAETLAGASGAPAAEIEGIPPVAMRTVERLACDGTFRRVVLGPKSQVIDVGRKSRVVSPAARRAVVARDQGACQWPACDRDGKHVHHLKHWARGGTTDLPNQALVCYWHHRMLHEGGWQLIREPWGRAFALRPPPLFSRPRHLELLGWPPAATAPRHLGWIPGVSSRGG